MSESAFIDPTTLEGQTYWQRRHTTATIAEELAGILAHITWVKCNASSHLDGPENHELFLAWKKISDLHRDLAR